MSTPVLDFYCERVGSGLGAEPLNAATNLAFFAAAWLAWRLARRNGTLDGATAALLALVVAIGTGSSLFHTFATPWARVLDELPILLFQLLFLWLYVRRIAHLPRAAAAGAIAAYLAAALYARQFPHLLNGSLIYAPAVLMTAAMGLHYWLMRQPQPPLLAIAAAILVAAVFSRTLDGAVCARFPLGTHFVWHLLVAAVIYCCLRALLVSRPRKPA